MRHVMITSGDERYGDFLMDHWLVSLLDNVDLGNIDVYVIDFGLRKEQREVARVQGDPMSCVGRGRQHNQHSVQGHCRTTRPEQL